MTPLTPALDCVCFDARQAKLSSADLADFSTNLLNNFVKLSKRILKIQEFILGHWEL